MAVFLYLKEYIIFLVKPKKVKGNTKKETFERIT
jgi:hypothetical protein